MKEQIILQTQDAIEQLIAFLDSIYYEGYAQQLASEHPEQFYQQLNEFLENHLNK